MEARRTEQYHDDAVVCSGAAHARGADPPVHLGWSGLHRGIEPRSCGCPTRRCPSAWRFPRGEWTRPKGIATCRRVLERPAVLRPAPVPGAGVRTRSWVLRRSRTWKSSADPPAEAAGQGTAGGGSAGRASCQGARLSRVRAHHGLILPYRGDSSRPRVPGRGPLRPWQRSPGRPRCADSGRDCWTAGSAHRLPLEMRQSPRLRRPLARPYRERLPGCGASPCRRSERGCPARPHGIVKVKYTPRRPRHSMDPGWPWLHGWWPRDGHQNSTLYRISSPRPKQASGPASKGIPRPGDGIQKTELPRGSPGSGSGWSWSPSLESLLGVRSLTVPG